MTSQTASLSNILQNCIDNLLLAEQQIQDTNGQKEVLDFALDKFWSDTSTIAQKLSFECTKVCLCFSQPPMPTPSETSSLLSALESAVVCLVVVWHKLPSALGLTLAEEVKAAMVRAIRSARQLLKIIKDVGGEAVEERYRQSTGVVWQGCDLLEKCPRDNKAAVLKGLKEQNTLVADAFTEISEALEGDGSGWSNMGLDSEGEEEEEKWTNEDKDLIAPSVNLVKASKILYKRVLAAVERGGLCETPGQNQELDQIFQDCKQVSTYVDVLILGLYPPLDIHSMEEQSQLLASQVGTALKTASQSHAAGEDDQPHLEFVQRAVDHNLDRMKEKLSHR